MEQSKYDEVKERQERIDYLVWKAKYDKLDELFFNQFAPTGQKE